MISEVIYAEFTIFKHSDESYSAWVDGLNGRVDWDMFDEFKGMMNEDAYTHPVIKPILLEYDHERDGAITLVAELVKIDYEDQQGTGEGEILHLPAYYDIANCKVIRFEPLTLR